MLFSGALEKITRSELRELVPNSINDQIGRSLRYPFIYAAFEPTHC